MSPGQEFDTEAMAWFAGAVFPIWFAGIHTIMLTMSKHSKNNDMVFSCVFKI